MHYLVELITVQLTDAGIFNFWRNYQKSLIFSILIVSLLANKNKQTVFNEFDSHRETNTGLVSN